MNVIFFKPRVFIVTLFSLCAIAYFCPDSVSAAAVDTEEKIFSFDDQYIQLEARIFSGESKSTFGFEVSMTPQPGWKILAGNSSSIKPLRLKFSPAKCLKLKGATQVSAPDLSGTDDSGAYSEYFTKTASIRQEFSPLKCAQKNGLEGKATVTYLLCQDNKCVGPFSKEISFRAPDRK